MPWSSLRQLSSKAYAWQDWAGVIGLNEMGTHIRPFIYRQVWKIPSSALSTAVAMRRSTMRWLKPPRCCLILTHDNHFTQEAFTILL